MSAAQERFDADPDGGIEGTVETKTKHTLPTEGRRAMVATTLGAGLGLLAALFSRRDRRRSEEAGD